jgi:hypothetical protein
MPQQVPERAGVVTRVFERRSASRRISSKIKGRYGTSKNPVCVPKENPERAFQTAMFYRHHGAVDIDHERDIRRCGPDTCRPSLCRDAYPPSAIVGA